MSGILGDSSFHTTWMEITQWCLDARYSGLRCKVNFLSWLALWQGWLESWDQLGQVTGVPSCTLFSMAVSESLASYIANSQLKKECSKRIKWKLQDVLRPKPRNSIILPLSTGQGTHYSQPKVKGRGITVYISIK